MNDIDILEKLAISTRTACECGLTNGSEKEKWLKEAQAIENLISRVKELESIEQIHREDNGKLQEKVTKLEDNLYAANNIISDQIDLLKDSIPKEKVREVIKRLDKRAVESGEMNYFANLTIGEALSFKHFLERELLQEER